MDAIAKKFDFLINDYGFQYRFQEFHKCYGGNWNVYTYSFYNQSGCFTIHSLPQRGELDFYYAHAFSTKREELYEKIVNIRSIEPEIWNKHSKIGIFNKPLFWSNTEKVLDVLADVIKAHIVKYGEFFEIRVIDMNN